MRKPDGADRALWHCLICERSRLPDSGWHDPLVPISDVELRARNAAMAARVRARWQAADTERRTLTLTGGVGQTCATMWLQLAVAVVSRRGIYGVVW